MGRSFFSAPYACIDLHARATGAADERLCGQHAAYSVQLLGVGMLVCWCGMLCAAHGIMASFVYMGLGYESVYLSGRYALFQMHLFAARVCFCLSIGAVSAV